MTTWMQEGLKARGNIVHQTAVISPEAEIGSNNVIGPFCLIGPGVKIGDENTFDSYVSVGQTAEHREYFTKRGRVEIGNHNIMREFVTVNSSTRYITRMGDYCTMLRGSHLSHDSVLEDGVTASCNVLIGGETHVMRGSNLGLGCIIHQRQVIGSYSMIGMGAIVTKKTIIKPGQIWVGNPAKAIRANKVGIDRANLSLEQMVEELQRFHEIREGKCAYR